MIQLWNCYNQKTIKTDRLNRPASKFCNNPTVELLESENYYIPFDVKMYCSIWLLRTVDALISTGLRALGYTYVSIGNRPKQSFIL